MKNLSRAFFEEAKWLRQGYTPTVEEYLAVALHSTGLYLLVSASLVGLGNMVSKDVFEWLFNDPKIVRASALICRLMDDIASHKVCRACVCVYICIYADTWVIYHPSNVTN